MKYDNDCKASHIEQICFDKMGQNTSATRFAKQATFRRKGKNKGRFFYC